ncbi:metallophosphoesterase family protein [Leisingera sp. D0M16]|uniref:metallophosphoesterase family protein n=1 Tax=Leisingera coralii TaxID=3351347 RepID=UPI003B7AA4D4
MKIEYIKFITAPYFGANKLKGSEHIGMGVPDCGTVLACSLASIRSNHYHQSDCQSPGAMPSTRARCIKKVEGDPLIVLSSLFQKFGDWAGQGASFPDPAPDIPLCVIGDVHGCLPLLERMLRQVPHGHRIILAGDYIDRGEQSAEVLRYLRERPDLTCLMGNHEDMLLRFLQDPGGEGGRWIRNGGLQTLASFDVRGARPQMNREELCECRDRLQEAMGETLTSWVAGLETSVLSGNVLAVHAGADPRAAPDEQTEDAILWGHPDFIRKPRRDGIWVVHGHTIVNQPAAEQGRIAVDTGAYATGTLSAVCLDGSAPRFLTAQM